MVGEFSRGVLGIFDVRGRKDEESCYKLHLSVTVKRGRMFIFNEIYGLCLSNVSTREGQSYFQERAKIQADQQVVMVI